MTIASTNRTIGRLAALGEGLGLKAFREVSPGVPRSYAPRTDLVWCSPELQSEAVGALDRLAERAGVTSVLVKGRFPVVGFEVEGTDPTSKTMEADFANLQVMGYPIGALVVDNAPARSAAREAAPRNLGDIHRRACRLRRTAALWSGPRALAVVDASRLPTVTPRLPSPPAASALCRPSNLGGSRDDSTRVRDELVRRGESLGFLVTCDAEPELPKRVHAARLRALTESGGNPTGPAAVHLGLAGDELGDDRFRSWVRPEEAFTRQRLDVVWSISTPPGLVAAHGLLREADPEFKILWPEASFGPLLPVAAFEIDIHVGKHAGGSLLHLSRAARLGALFVPDAEKDAGEEMIETYRRVMPLGAVSVMGFTEVP